MNQPEAIELELLPDHVLIEIFRGLSTHDLVNYRRVSKRWFCLISCPKYFQRAHRLCFYGCALSAACPPLSVFKNSSQPFFRFLTIGKVECHLRNNEWKDWWNSWSEIGDRITHLKFNHDASKFIHSRILGDGSNWSQLIELKVNSSLTNFPLNLKIPSLKTLKLMCGDKSKCLEKNFPNLQNLHIKEIDGRRFSDWELQRLRGFKCHPSQLRALKTKTIQTLSLQNHDVTYLNDKQLIESLISKQENLLELKIDISGIYALEYWCQFSQLTKLKINISRIAGRPLGNYFTQLKNLKKIQIRLFESNCSCFYGHKVVDLPRLNEYSISAPSQCEECWTSCLQSFRNAKRGIIFHLEKIKNYLHLLQNLEWFKTDRNDYYLKVGDGEDRNLDIKQLPNVIKLYSCGGLLKESYRAIAEFFPNLRFLDSFGFDPLILKFLPGLQELNITLNITIPDACSRSMIEGIVQYGKNLRIIRILHDRWKHHTKYLFDNLELLVQVTDFYGFTVYTRSSFECQ